MSGVRLGLGFDRLWFGYDRLGLGYGRRFVYA